MLTLRSPSSTKAECIFENLHMKFFVDDFWKHEIKIQQYTTPGKYFQQFYSPFLALQ